MTLLNVSALYLLSTGSVIILLHFLRARSRRLDVSALFLWEGLRSEPRSRAARLRRTVDPLLLLQLLVLALIALALSRPVLQGSRGRLEALAIVLDGSASMRAQNDSGVSLYKIARDRAQQLVNRYPTTPATIIQLATRPLILLEKSDDHQAMRRAIDSSGPTWYGDGTSAMLSGLLDSQGGIESFERVVLFTDNPPPGTPEGVETVVLSRGENVGITAFTVRENPHLQGSTAFLKLRNDTASYFEQTLCVGDETNEVVLSPLLGPGEERTFVVPFPGSKGPVFTATIEADDAFSPDDVRYYALNGSATRRVRSVGGGNLYLEAALRASAPTTTVPATDLGTVDLTLAYNAELSGDTIGNILLVHSSYDGLVELADDSASGSVEILGEDDPLLGSVSAADFRVSHSPRVTLMGEWRVVATVDGEPFLCRYTDDVRTIVLIAPDLMTTNLPLTLGFPVLVSNILSFFSPLPAEVEYDWSAAGQYVPIDRYGRVRELRDPEGREIPIAREVPFFLPEEPGIYTLETIRGAYALSVNVDAAESTAAPAFSQVAGRHTAQVGKADLFPLWPYIAAAALLALVAETYVYQGWHPRWSR